MIRKLLIQLDALNLKTPIKVAVIGGGCIIIAAVISSVFQLLSGFIHEPSPARTEVNSGNNTINLAMFQLVAHDTPSALPNKEILAPNFEKSLPSTIEVKTPEAPLVIVANPSVRITRWKEGEVLYGEKIGPGTVTAGFQITFVNIGNVTANEVKAEWRIVDNGNTITNPDDWLRSINRQPWGPANLPPGAKALFQYGPHISASGVGTLELFLKISYQNALTGKNHSKEYRGFVDYSVSKVGDSKGYLLTPVEHG